MLEYPARFDPAEEGGYVIRFLDVPEAITQGETIDEGMALAADALQLILGNYIRRRLEIPLPGKARGKHTRLVRLPALVEMKVRLYRELRAAGVRKAELARRLGWQKTQVERLLDFGHASRLDQLEQAFAALGKRIGVEVLDAA